MAEYKIPEITKPKSSTGFSPKKQVEGLKKRLEGSGVDTKKIDSRNFLEKALNLTPKQNVLFDIFEVLERPQKAIFSGVKAMQGGEDFFQGAIKGLQGKEKVMFKEILHNAGLDDSGKKFGADDILGFVGEVFADPIDLALIPVTGGASAALKGVDVAKDLEKTRKFVSPLTLAAKGTVKAGKKGISLADEGLTAAFKFADAQKLKKGLASGEDINKIEKSLRAVQGYQDAKKVVKGTFNMAASLPKGVVNEVYKIMGKAGSSKAKLRIKLGELTNKIDDFATTAGKNSDEVGREIQEIIEFRNYKPKTTVRDLLQSPFRDKTPLNRALGRKLKKLFEKTDIDFVKTFDKTKLANGVDAFFLKDPKLLDDFLDKAEHLLLTDPDFEFISHLTNNPRFYSAADRKRYAELMKDDNFKGLVDFTENTQKEMLDVLDTSFKVLFGENTPKGYVRHAATDARKDIPKYMQRTIEDLDPTAFKGNMDAFTGRTYQMSAKEANLITRTNVDRMINSGELTEKQIEFWKKKENMDLFESTIQKSMADFIETAPDFAKSVDTMDIALAQAVVTDPSLMYQVEKGENLRRGYVAVKTKDLRKKLTKMAQYSSNDAIEALKKGLPRTEQMAIDKNIYDIIGRLGNEKESKDLVKILDTINNLFKKNKLLSPGFQMRNAVGNYTNMYLAGVPLRKINKNFARANKVMMKGEGVFEKATKEGIQALSKNEKEIYKWYTEFLENNFDNIGSKIWDLPEDIVKKIGDDEGKKNVLNTIMSKNAAANEAMDKRYRLSLYMYATENPAILAKNGANSAEEFVRRVLFDPNDLSAVEKELYKKAVPFYTFAKKNLAYQMRNLFDNPVKYKRLKKTIGQIWESQDINVENIEDYKRENFWIPIPGLTKDGKYTALKLNLPLGDLADFLGNPMRKVVSSLSPGMRAPFELAMNKQVFTQRPISDFKGQKGFQIPWLTRTQEYMIGQAGLDVPVSFLGDIARTGKEVVTGEAKERSLLENIDQALGRSVTSVGDVEKAETSRAYDELNELRELMSYYKQEGLEIKTLADIENKNKPLSDLMERLKALQNNQNKKRLFD